MKSKRLITLGAAAVLLSSARSNAAFTVDYDFTAAPPDTANAVVAGSDSTAVTTTPATVSGNWQISAISDTAFINGDVMNSTEAFAFGSTNYFTVSLGAADPLAPISLDSLEIRWGGTRTSAQANFNANLRVQYSFDNFASAGTLASLSPDTLFINGTSVFTDATVDLSGVQFDNLDSVAFRIYAFSPERGSPGLAADQRIRVLDIGFTGSVVPEPSGALLLLGGLGALAGSRRR